MSGSKPYRVEKKSGVWWLVSPENEKMFYTSVQCVNPVQESGVKGSLNYDGPASLGGDLQAWITRTQARLKEWGFRGLGAWNHDLWHWRGIPLTDSLSVWRIAQRDGKMKPVFDLDFESRVDEIIKEATKVYKHVPSLVGYFTDNEIRWSLDYIRQYHAYGKKDPNNRAVIDLLKARHKSVARLNQAWGSKVTSFEALAGLKKLPVSDDRLRPDALAFLEKLARTYFKATSKALRRHDPGRLNLGVRHAGLPPIEVTRAQKGCTDVYSVNLYIQEARLDEAALLRHHLACGGQPIWCTEFSFHAPWDNRSGDRNTCGFSSRVAKQSSRGPAYAAMVGHAASLPFMIGMDWFQYSDEPPKGRNDGEDVNFGIVDIHDKPYERLTAAMRATNLKVDRVHAASGSWRLKAKPAVTPSMEISREGSVLKGLSMRPSADPQPKQAPASACICWSPKGLSVWVEVKDAERTVKIETLKDSIEWFWQTDVVELLLRKNQAIPEFLDEASFKVWAVPDALGRGKAWLGGIHKGVRSKGKAAGATAKQVQVPGGYGMNFFVPYSAVQDKPFAAGQTLRFNLLVEDAEKVRETYWSAHQGQLTTEKPATWGTIKLV
ncbi:MAG: hypothetical protein V4498_08245 [candidate division FCPU426 bacterium]